MNESSNRTYFYRSETTFSQALNWLKLIIILSFMFRPDPAGYNVEKIIISNGKTFTMEDKLTVPFIGWNGRLLCKNIRDIQLTWKPTWFHDTYRDCLSTCMKRNCDVLLFYISMGIGSVIHDTKIVTKDFGGLGNSDSYRHRSILRILITSSVPARSAENSVQ